MLSIRAYCDGREITEHKDDQVQEIADYIDKYSHVNIDISGSDERNCSTMTPRKNVGYKCCKITSWRGNGILKELYGIYDMKYNNIRDIAEEVLHGTVRKDLTFDFEVAR